MESLPTRRRLLELVERYPGLHVRELARQAGMSEALALYHLQKLLEAELVKVETDQNYRRFYSTEGQGPTEEERELMAFLRREVPLQIVLHLLERQSASNQDLSDILGLAKSTVSYHLGGLQAVGLVTRVPEGEAYTLADSRRVARLLLRYQPPKDVASRFGDLWTRFYYGHRARNRD